jgi:glutaminyl-tRNA synthetase
MSESATVSSTNFIHHIIRDDIANGKYPHPKTRFPPEPNGYLHIGHAKSIVLNFGLAAEFNGVCHLRFDDTNPQNEKIDFVDAIKADVHWLGYDWGPHLYFASNYFEQLYNFALELIEKGLAYVCDLTVEETRAYRGTLTEPGQNSPFRDRSIEENRTLFERMRAGEFPEGSRTLRARIDMASANINLRDPVLYRIKHGVIHHQTGQAWCLYPTYDYTHPLCDALEGITHSLCTLEFEDHRPFYDWVVEHTSVPARPRQIEFSRLNIEYYPMSKRILTQLVNEKIVAGWDDPRLPTLAGLRRRGYTPESLREFCRRIGITKADGYIELSFLETIVREDLDNRAPRALAVLDPLRVIIDNYPTDSQECLEVANHPKNDTLGQRSLTFSREIYIERSDFSEQPPKGFKRLVLGGEVRLRHAYILKCERVIKNDQGDITTLHATIDFETLGKAPQGRKVKGVIHWVDAKTAIQAEIRLYDRLFAIAHPTFNPQNLHQELNPTSLTILTQALVEPNLTQANTDSRFQFERLGYFIADSDTTAHKPVFNRIVTLRDNWTPA